MSGESEYYHPILQAMIASAQNNRDIEKEKNAVEQHKSALALQQRVQAEIEHQHEIENAHTEKQFQLLKATNEAQQSANKMAMLQSAAQGLRTGAINPSAFQQQGVTQPSVPLPTGGSMPALNNVAGTPQDQLDLPLVGRVPLSAFQNPQQYLAQLRQSELDKAQATAEGQEPSKINEIEATGENQKAVQKLIQEREDARSKREIDAKESLAQLQRASEEKRTGMTAGATIQAARIRAGATGKAKEPDPADVKAAAYEMATGQAKYSPSTPLGRAAITELQGSGTKIVDPKDTQILKNLNDLNPVFEQLRQFGNKYLPSEAKYGPGTAKALALANSVQNLYPSDAKKDLDIINSSAVNLGKNLEGLTGGRMNQKQIDLDLKAYGGMNQTQEQFNRGVDALENKYITKQQDNILGGMTDAQKAEIIKRHGLKNLKIVPGGLENQVAPKPGERVVVRDPSTGQLMEVPNAGTAH